VSRASETIPFFFVNPTIAVDDARGWIYVAYAAGTPDGQWDIQLAATHDDGKTWKRTRLDDDATCANHMVPNLALDPGDGTQNVSSVSELHATLQTFAASGASEPHTARSSM